MAHRMHLLLVVGLGVSGCGDDGGGATTTGVGNGTTSTSTTSGTPQTSTTSGGSTSSGAADSSSGDDTAGPTTGGGQTTSGSSGSDGSTAGDDSDSSGGMQTECGGEQCDSATQICVERAKGGPSMIGCEPVPKGCEDDRTCACVGVPLCTVGLMQCTDVADNTVFCDSGLD